MKNDDPSHFPSSSEMSESEVVKVLLGGGLFFLLGVMFIVWSIELIRGLIRKPEFLDILVLGPSSILIAGLGLDFRTFTGVVDGAKRADHHVRGRYPGGCSSTPGSHTARRSARWISLSPASPRW